jgi:hypothetical protein
VAGWEDVRVRRLAVLGVVGALILGLGACGDDRPEGADPAQVDAMEPPPVGDCRNIKRSGMDAPTDATEVIDCTEPHNAENYASGAMPPEHATLAWDSPELDTWAYGTCTGALREHLGANQSSLMRTILRWTWFRPSEKAWEDGARWYRCDLVGGGGPGQHYLDLPTTTKDLLKSKQDDHWMTCVRGEEVSTGARVPCSQKHVWRAVTTIKVGEPADTWPGDAAVEAKTKDYCASSVAAWSGYPTDYDYAYTWYGEAEWKAGNRRSVCWAKTDQ